MIHSLKFFNLFQNTTSKCFRLVAFGKAFCFPETSIDDIHNYRCRSACTQGLLHYLLFSCKPCPPYCRPNAPYHFHTNFSFYSPYHFSSGWLIKSLLITLLIPCLSGCYPLGLLVVSWFIAFYFVALGYWWRRHPATDILCLKKLIVVGVKSKITFVFLTVRVMAFAYVI